MAKKNNKLVEALLAHCRQKPGMEGTIYSSDREPAFNILGGFLDGFARFYLDEKPPVIMLRCADCQREQLAKEFGNVKVSERMEWDSQGWAWTDIALDGKMSAETLASLIDQSYQLVYDSDAIDDVRKHRIQLVTRRLDQRQMLEELISYFGLAHRRNDILQIAKPAALLKTRAMSESAMGLGQTKIGGRPDLPQDLKWPKHPGGKSLAFVAQVNLAELRATVRLEDLPEAGMLYFFSAYGWYDEEMGPTWPEDEEPTPEWAKVLFAPAADAALERRKRPSDVNGFKSAAVEFLPAISLPHPQEPAMSAIEWSEAEMESYGNLADSFGAVCDHTLGRPPKHRLGGYADYEQAFYEVVAEEHLQLLFQLATDGNTQMQWGDGGYIYFWIKPDDLKRRDFSTIFTDSQGG